MRTILTGAVAIGLLALSPVPASAQRTEVAAGASTAHRWGTRIDGRWHAGYQAPGGWEAYRRPVQGATLPQYWVQPAFTIVDYNGYGLPAPIYGYVWTRYYDDAVLTDRSGRIYGSRDDIPWDQHEGGYEDQAGALPASTVHVAAPASAPPAAAPIRAGSAMPHPDGPPPPPGRLPYDASVPMAGDYDGRWVGTWYGNDGRTYSGEYRGRYQGSVPPPPVQAPPPPYRGAPMPPPGYGYGYGYGAPGVYYAPPGTTTTIIIQPGVTTTTTYEEVVPASRTRWKPRAKAKCAC